MNFTHSPLRSSYAWFFAMLFLLASSCKVTKNTQDEAVLSEIAKDKLLIASFKKDSGSDAVWVSDTALIHQVESWQGSGDYPGVDQWASATIPAGTNLYGGLPGQSEYYSIAQTVTAVDTMQVPYWKSLQVKPNPTHGYRPYVGVFELKQSSNVAIARTLANPQYGKGGAWQVYLEDYQTLLTTLDTIVLKN